jgi:PKD repeat protein
LVRKRTLEWRLGGTPSAFVFRDARDLALWMPLGDSHIVARLDASTAEGGAPLRVRFDASGSRAASGVPLSFAWDFGDGGTGEGAVTEHVYTRPGTFRAQVVATDGSASAEAAVIISVDGDGFPDAPGYDAETRDSFDATDGAVCVEVGAGMR